MLLAVGYVGMNLCFKTMMYGCAKTLGLVKYMTTQDEGFETLNHLLVTTDIKQKVAKTHRLLVMMEQNLIHECIKMAMIDLYGTIHVINQLLETCIGQKHQHQKLYLSSWRSLDLPLNHLSTQIQVFNIRFDDLLKIMTMVKMMTI